MHALKIAVVQFEPIFGHKEKNIEKIKHLICNLAADVIVLPELCTTGYFFRDRTQVLAASEPQSGPTSAFFMEMAKHLGAIIVAGVAESEGDHVYNSCLIAVPKQSKVSMYRKTHLFYREKECFDPGNTGFFVVKDSYRDVVIGPMVCYDWRFPESARILMLRGADLIVCPSNLVTDAWRMVMPARAIENKVYLAVANRIGDETNNEETLRFKGQSAIYGYNGEILAKADAHQESVIFADAYPQATRDKSFNALNNVLTDRQPHHYKRLVK